MKQKISKESEMLFSKFSKEAIANKRRRYDRTWKAFVTSLVKSNSNITAELVNEIAMELLELQNAQQKESRMMNVISNIMKIRHDTTKSIIQNVR
jgi:hypothetical protein